MKQHAGFFRNNLNPTLDVQPEQKKIWAIPFLPTKENNNNSEKNI